MREWERGQSEGERRCLAEGGETGESVGEREIVRPHCFFGSPFSRD